jgi:uncharacterized caspase-like protein
MPEAGGFRRLALVIATTEYDDHRLARLAAPLSDALRLAHVLGDPEKGAFVVETLVNAEAQTVQRRLERFCKADRRHDDMVLVYLTGHGVKDDDGNLYFALRDTDRDLLRTTALSAELMSAVLNDSPGSGPGVDAGLLLQRRHRQSTTPESGHRGGPGRDLRGRARQGRSGRLRRSRAGMGERRRLFIHLGVG